MCPFKKSCMKGWLRHTRAVEIVDTVLNDGIFWCHETKDRRRKNRSFCGGALILLEKEKGLAASFPVRIGIMIGEISPDQLKNQKSVFNTRAEFVAHHKN